MKLGGCTWCGERVISVRTLRWCCGERVISVRTFRRSSAFLTGRYNRGQTTVIIRGGMSGACSTTEDTSLVLLVA